MFILIPCFIYGQTAEDGDTLWTRTYGGELYDAAFSVQQISDGGYIICGFTESFNLDERAVWLVKADSNGDTLWTRIYMKGCTYSCQQTADGGYILAGYTMTGICSDALLLKTNEEGNILWISIYGSPNNVDGINSVQQTSDGGYIAAGWTVLPGTRNSDIWLLKTNPHGDTLWTRIYGGDINEHAHSVQQTSDGGYIVTGWTKSFGAGWSDVWLLKLDEMGDTIWTRTYGRQYVDGGNSVCQTSDGGYVIAGYCELLNHFNEDIWILKTDEQGDILWTRTYGGDGNERAESILQTIDGGYIVAGWTKSFGTSDEDLWLLKTDEQGDTLWTRIYGGSDNDGGACINKSTDGGYVIVGYTRSFGAGSQDMWLLKIDATTGFDELPKPKEFVLDQNYPNPFNAETIIRYHLPEASNVTLEIYDLLGHKVEAPINKKQQSGYHQVNWNGNDVSSGVYFYRIRAGVYNDTKMMLLIK